MSIDTSPYVGLCPFSEELSRYYFGRSRDVALLLDNIRGGRIVIVYGRTGCGKTSVIRAGLVPWLRALQREKVGYGDQESEPGGPPFVFFTHDKWQAPGFLNSIKAGLAQNLVDARSSLGGTHHADLTPEAHPPAAPPSDLPLFEWVRLQNSEGRDVHLILDQFEEYLFYAQQRQDSVDGDIYASEA